MKARPEPVFRYFSKANALYLSVKAMVHTHSSGSLELVYCTKPLACLASRSSRSFVHPT